MAYSVIANCYNDLKRYNLSLEYCEKALKLCEYFVEVMMTKYQNLQYLGRITEQDDILQKIIKINPGRYETLEEYCNKLII